MRRRVIRALLAVCALSAAAGACGVELAGSGGGAGPDGGSDPGVDATASGEGVDPASDGAAEGDSTTSPPGDAAGTSDAPAPSDAGADSKTDAGADGGILFKCLDAGTMTSDCSTCAGHTLGCVLCSTTSAAIYGVCVPIGSSCRQDYTPPGYDWCKCNTADAAACILPNQACDPFAGGVCVTCGENSTEGDNCKVGGKCHQAPVKCQ